MKLSRRLATTALATATAAVALTAGAGAAAADPAGDWCNHGAGSTLIHE